MVCNVMCFILVWCGVNWCQQVESGKHSEGEDQDKIVPKRQPQKGDNDVVEAHATAFNQTGKLLSNHVAKGVNCSEMF